MEAEGQTEGQAQEKILFDAKILQTFAEAVLIGNGTSTLSHLSPTRNRITKKTNRRPPSKRKNHSHSPNRSRSQRRRYTWYQSNPFLYGED